MTMAPSPGLVARRWAQAGRSACLRPRIDMTAMRAGLKSTPSARNAAL
jgi:hypothetical protein